MGAFASVMPRPTWSGFHSLLSRGLETPGKQTVEVHSMAFADPISFPINAVANSLARTGSGPGTGSFSKDDGTVKLSVSHAPSKGGRVRRLLRVDHSKIVPDPLMPAVNRPYNMSVHIVVDAPTYGYSLVEQQQLVEAFAAYLVAGSSAATKKLLGGEN